MFFVRIFYALQNNQIQISVTRINKQTCIGVLSKSYDQMNIPEYQSSFAMLPPVNEEI